MKSNKLFMVILLGGMLSSGMSFGMDTGQMKGEEPVQEPSRMDMLSKWLFEKYEHADKVALMALLVPVLYKVATTGADYKEFDALMKGEEWSSRHGGSLYGYSTLQKLQKLLVTGAGMFTKSTKPTMAGILLAKAVEHAKNVFDQNTEFLLGLGTAFMGYKYLTVAAQGWLDTPAMKAHAIDKQIEILEDTYNNMGYFKYMTGGAIGLQDAIKFLKAEKLKDQAAIEQ